MKLRVLAQINKKPLLQDVFLTYPKLKANEVRIHVQYCGICHSDLHLIDGDWGDQKLPLVPGHEAIGVITEVGSKVSEKRIGEWVGVGWQAGCCGQCEYCQSDRENFCQKNQATCVGQFGGFSQVLHAQSRFAVPLPKKMDPQVAGPLLCGGVTVYSPLSRHLGRGKKNVAILGVGGLGHMAVQMAAKMGHTVTALSTNPKKKAELKKMGAKHFVNTKIKDWTKKNQKQFDFILVTAYANLNWNEILTTLAPRGQICFVGLPSEPIKLSALELALNDRMVSGSVIGSPSQIKEMLEFCASKAIQPWIEMINPSEVNSALKRLRKNDVKYRFVVDLRDWSL